MIYRVHYNWFTMPDRGEFYYDWTVGREYPLYEFSEIKSEVERIEIKGTLSNRIAIIHFKNGAKIEQHNITAIIEIEEDGDTEEETTGRDSK